MAKRFTDTGKWSDPWYRALPPIQKHGWCYLLDNCDTAGVISLDRDLANYQIGAEVDWDGLIAESEGRIEPIGRKKLWLTGFIGFQYGTISDGCKAHRPVFASLEKHGLTERYFKGYPNPLDTLKDKDKDKDKEKDKETEGGVGETKPRRFVKPSVEQVAAYCLERRNEVQAQRFWDFYESKGWKVGSEGMRDWKAAVRNWEANGNQRGSPKKAALRTGPGLIFDPDCPTSDAI